MESRTVARTLKIHETTTPAGSLSDVLLRLEDGGLAIENEDGTLPLPQGALEAAMGRFGAPLEEGVRLTSVGVLDLGEGRIVRHVRHLDRYDVIARDYLVYEAPGKDPLCALATTVAGALDHLARAARRP